MDYPFNIQGFLNGDCSYGAVGMHNLTRPLSAASRRAEPLAAYHVLSTVPYCVRNKCKDFRMREYERLTAEISASLWRRYNGPVYLLTDRQEAAYVRKTV